MAQVRDQRPNREEAMLGKRSCEVPVNPWAAAEHGQRGAK